MRNRQIEFLLVRTRNQRWTFPKGGVEPGLTHAQAAALEAYEEAGVHGRMEEAAFTCYSHGNSRQPGKRVTVNAHLCAVSRLEAPPEKGRNPTWFSVSQAKRRLRDRRSPNDAAVLARVLDEAVLRIRSQSQACTSNEEWREDALCKVPFEAGNVAGVYGRLRGASWSVRRRGDLGDTAALEVALNAYLCEVLRLSPSPALRQGAELPLKKEPKRLLAGPPANDTVLPRRSNDILRITEVTDIDKARGTPDKPTPPRS